LGSSAASILARAKLARTTPKIHRDRRKSIRLSSLRHRTAISQGENRVSNGERNKKLPVTAQKIVPQKLLPELNQLSTWIENLTRHALPRILRPKNAEVKLTQFLCFSIPILDLRPSS
jgi:hypothetical protein